MLAEPLDTPDTDECFVQQSDDCTEAATTLRPIMDGLRLRSVPVCEPCARELDNRNEAAYERNQADLRNGVSLTVQQQYELAAEQKVRGR